MKDIKIMSFIGRNFAPGLAAILAAALSIGAAGEVSAQDQRGQEERSCSDHYQGETSRVYSCDDDSVGWTLPRDALRIDKPLKPGPNAIVREVPEKIIEKPARWIGKRLGL